MSLPHVARGEDDYRHAGLRPEEAAKAMAVPEGFSVALFAGEPDVRQPIGFALDDRGRLWVAESYSYPVRQSEDQARDRILIFEDADGDGRFDSRKVFIEKLNLLSGIEIGFGGVWAGAAPHFLFIPDRNGDDVPDGPPRVLLDGWGYQDTHETLNTFIWGPDGWLYGCHGIFTHSKVGKPGTPDPERVRLNAGIWRYHPTRHLFEVFCQGTSNPWGVDFNDHGQAFLTACVIPHLFHVIQGGRYERQAGQHFNPHTYEDLKTIADHRHWVGANPHGGNNRSDSAGGGHAHCGAMVYLGGSWPPEYRNSIFFSNIHGQRVNRDLLVERGSGYLGRHAPDFIFSNDRWSQTLNLRYGPDGQVYLIDWYDRQACHTRNPGDHDRSNGRIFKVTYRGSGSGPLAPAAGLDLRKHSDLELAELQLHVNDWYVRHARRVLQERSAEGRVDPPAREALARLAFEHPDETRRLRGLWALHVTGGLDEKQRLRALMDPSPYLRAWTVQLAAEDRKPPPEVLERFATLARDDPSPVVRLYLASGVMRLPLERRWAILEGLLGHGDDAGDQNLPLLYWYGAEPLAEADPDRALGLALRSKTPPILEYTARRIASSGSTEALAVVVRRLGKVEEEQARLGLLRGLRNALRGKRETPAPREWAQVFEVLAQSASPTLEWLALELAVKFHDARALGTMRQVLLDRKAERSRRQAALESLLEVRDGGLVPALQSLLTDTALSGEALRGLSVYDHPETPGVILQAYASLGLAEKRHALSALASRPPYARALLSAVGEKKVPVSDLSAALVRQMRNLKDREVNERIDQLWGVVGEPQEEKAWLIAKYRILLSAPSREEPDRSLGRAIFQKTCQQCHALFGSGEKVAPELTGSNRADLDYLLSNVLDPSALVAKDYLAHVVHTRDGRILTGIVREEGGETVKVTTSNESLVLARKDIRSLEESNLSLMPDDLLKPLREDEVHALFAYLRAPAQVPLLATAENLKGFFSGRDLTGWEGNAKLWRIEEGEIVARSPGLEKSEILRSDLLLSDFRLALEVKLVPDQAKGAIHFRSESPAEGGIKGYRSGVGQGSWGELRGEGGRGHLSGPCESAVRGGEWNRFEIVAVGTRVSTWLNGKPCAEVDDPKGPRRGIIAFELHPGRPAEARFRGFKLEMRSQEQNGLSGR